MNEIRPDISFCLLHTAARAEPLLAFLESLAAHAGPVDYEVIVATDPSAEHPLAAIERAYPEITILETAIAPRPVAARNLALRLAKGRYLACWDENIRLLPATLAVLLAFLEENPETGLAAPRIVDHASRTLPTVRTLPSLATLLCLHTPMGSLLPAAPGIIGRHLLADEDHLLPFAGEWLLESCLVIRREATEEIGLFDEGFSSLYADADLCLRARLAGWHLQYLAGSVAVQHNPQLCRVHAHAPGSNPPRTAGDCTRFLLKKWLRPVPE
jgi:GT2 family glycosyltransferase